MAGQNDETIREMLAEIIEKLASLERDLAAIRQDMKSVVRR